MSGIFDKMKDSLWGVLNSPGGVPVDVDEWQDDDDDMINSGHIYESETSREVHEPLPRSKERRSEVASGRRTQGHKVLEMYGRPGDYNGPEVVIRHPVDVAEAAKICDFIRDGKMCVVDLTDMEREMAQRIADFLGGACYAVNGCIERISKDIFIIVPEGIRITCDVRDELERDGYSIPKASSHTR